MRRITRALLACAVLAGVAATAALAMDYSYIQTGTYSSTVKVPGSSGAIEFKGGTYKLSFKLTSATRKGIRTVRNMALGPVPSLCAKPPAKAGETTEYVSHTLPRQANFAPATTNGFIVGSYVLSGGKWKHDPRNQSYSGLLPHIDFALVYNTKPTRFNPNPLTLPSVTVVYRIDDNGKIKKTGKFVCTTASVVTLKRTG